MELTKKENDSLAIPSYDLGGVLPDLNELEVVPLDLSIDYWTPESPGESKRVFFKGVREEEKKDETTGEPYLAEVAYFIEQTDEGHKQIINQSVKMVAAVKQLAPGTPLQVTYTGKKRTQTGHNIDTWHIQPLVSRKPVQDDPDDIFS
jgi:hypothetical protein